MPTSRLEAFSDGVLAIIITIMVLELDVPEGHSFSDLISTAGMSLLTYLLSFVYVGIYWNNHHHLLHMTRRVTGGVLWANLHLLFWLSLLPFTTAWMDQSALASAPVLIYGVNLLGAAVAYFILQTVIIRSEGPESTLQNALGRDLKGKSSPVIYLTGIGLAALGGVLDDFWTYVGLTFFIAAAIMWLIPDRRIERMIDVDRLLGE